MRPTPIQHLRGSNLAGHIHVKRDDLLGSGIGSKTRKYESLIPYLKRTGIERVGVVTSFYGSNAYAAPALLMPHGFDIHLIHPISGRVNASRVSGTNSLVGNALASSLMVPLAKRIWIPQQEMEEHCTNLESTWRTQDNGRSVILPEGLTVKEALRGAVRLGKELAEQAPYAPEVYLDSGTGHTAAGVIFALNALGHSARVTVVGSFPVRTVCPNGKYQLRLMKWKKDFDDIALEELGMMPQLHLPRNWRAMQPVVARSFGSVPKSVLKYAHAFADLEGILLHPLYSAKMLMTMENEKPLKGTVAVLSGGGAALREYPQL